jgi:C4-dicarboxylate-specific signal transduction histidine kinase
VLRQHGNMSSATIMFVLARMMAEAERGQRGCALAFGPGLSAEVKARLCEPFFTTKAAGKGTGLGLAVSRHLLSQFEARLDAVNRETGGARFVVSMPAP